MTVIGICDDQAEQINLLMRYIGQFASGESIETFYATDPVAFLKLAEEKKPHIVFLDVEMESMNGIALGESIKQKYPSVPIIYVTAHEHYAVDAFRVRAFHYLIKPVTKEKFHQALDEALQAIRKNSAAKPEKVFTVQKKGEIVSLNYSDISHFEKIGHKICVYTAGSKIEYYGNFVSLLQKIDRSAFIQCHQGYIVNIQKARGFRDKVLLLDGNHTVPVSRSFVESTKEALARKLFAGRDQR